MNIRKVQAFGATLCASVVATASADVIFDNIGNMDGSDMVAGSVAASQQFEASFAQYDIAAVEDFSIEVGMTLNSISFVLGGWNGYAGYGGVEGYIVNIYSSIDAAGSGLNGDVLYMHAGSEYAEASSSWGGDLDHMTIDFGGAALNAGDYFISVVPINAFGVNGQTGIGISNIGGDNGYQANPGGGFGFGNYVQTGANYAYSLDGSVIPGPAAFCLLGIAGATIRRRRRQFKFLDISYTAHERAELFRPVFSI